MFINIPKDKIAPFLDEYQTIIHIMDQGYITTAAANGFTCKGCQESCCETRFYHHTYLEFYLLYEGLQSLPHNQYDHIRQLAAEVCRKAEICDHQKRPYRIMCPLNLAGGCSLYPFRPMICRLHGIAHELKRPDGNRLLGTGCHLFEKTCQNTPPLRLDRTPYYRQMAAVEKRLRLTIGLQTKIKLTVAEMILATTNDRRALKCAL
jgi:Fe-S-cluster containining protein